MITDVFLDWKRVNVCEHMINTASVVYSEECQHSGYKMGRGRNGGDGVKVELKSSQVNTRAVSRGQNDFIIQLITICSDL